MSGVTTHMYADNSRQTVIVRKYTTMDGLPFELLLLHNTHHWKRILLCELGSTYSRFTCPHNNGSSVNQKGKQNVWLVIYVCIGIVLVMKAQSLVTPNPWACVSCRMHAHHNIGTPFVGRAARPYVRCFAFACVLYDVVHKYPYIPKFRNEDMSFMRRTMIIQSWSVVSHAPILKNWEREWKKNRQTCVAQLVNVFASPLPLLLSVLIVIRSGGCIWHSIYCWCILNTTTSCGIFGSLWLAIGLLCIIRKLTFKFRDWTTYS